MSLKIMSDPLVPSDELGVRRLVERAERGDQAALPDLRQLLDNNPQLWRRFGDLAAHAEEALVGMAAGDNLVLRESVLRKVADLKADLAPSNPLERLLAERVAACWVAANYADTVFSQSNEGQASRPEQHRRRQDSAHRRLLEALKCFATVRRLLGTAAGPVARSPHPSA